MSTEMLFNPFDPEFRADPYPTYRRLRREDPLHWSPLGTGFWVVTRYEDVASMLVDPSFGMGSSIEDKRAVLGSGAAFTNVDTWMLLKDPPDHTRLRRLVSQAFTPRAVERMRSQVASAVDELLVEPRRRKSVDVMADLAFPLPVSVIARMLGVPAADRDRFHPWTEAVNLVFEPFVGPEESARCNRSAEELNAYLGALVAERRKEPRDDLLSALIAASDGNERLSEAELIGNAGLLLAGGFETTMGLIGNAALALLDHPHELARLFADPGLMRHAVEELLRYDSSVQYTGRWALEDVTVRDKTIRKGALVMLVVASANRDPERFAEPDRLDFSRADVAHLAFGGGRHFCLGAPLARLEAEVALSALVPLLRGAELAERPIRWRASAVNRVPLAVPLRLTG